MTKIFNIKSPSREMLRQSKYDNDLLIEALSAAQDSTSEQPKQQISIQTTGRLKKVVRL